MKAKLSDIASLAEIVGAVAVVISLLYVGVQVRDTTRAVRSAAVNDANTAIQSWYQMMASDPQVLKTFLDGTLSPEPLSRDEEFRFMMTTQAAMYAFQNSYLLGQEGSLDAGLMSSLNSGIQAGIDQLGQPIASRRDQPPCRRPGAVSVSPKLFRPHPGAAVNAFKSHMPTIVETARVFKIAKRPDSGRKRHPVARIQLHLPHDRQADTAPDRL